jgi:hypothetical protein
MRAPKVTLAIVAVAAIAALALLPTVRTVYRISQVAKQYRLESAVQKEIEADGVHKPSVNDVLDPKFMTKYGLDSRHDLDAQGYFSPTGNDWAKWPLETRKPAERLCDKSELIGFAKMTTFTIDRYKVFRCLGMVERRRLSSIFSPCSDLSHSLAMQRTAPRSDA